MSKKRSILFFAILFPLVVGCSIKSATTPIQESSTDTTKQTPSQSENDTQRPQDDTATFIPQTTSTPEHNRLTICLSSVIDSLYIYDGYDSLVKDSILESIYDGPIDHRSFDCQPVILEKLPSLADGDAVFKQVSLQNGDLVVDVQGEVVNLQPGILVFPTGCTRPECSIKYKGRDSLQMDQLVVTFKLLPELKWSDGQPLTAYDSVYSFNLAASPYTPSNKFKIERTVSYQALDDLTIKWIGLPGFIDQTYFLNFWSPLPEHIWGKFPPQALLEKEESVHKPVGWGPYIIKSYTANYIELVQNKYYFRTNEGLPRFDSIAYRFKGGDVEKNLDYILSGECDIVDQTSMLHEESGKLLRLDSLGDLNAIYIPGVVWMHSDFAILPAVNWQGFSANQAFRDSRLRHAIRDCLDRQKVVDEVFFGQTVVLDSYLPPDHPLYNSNLPHDEFNVIAGTSLLDEIGWIDEDNNPATPRIYQGQRMDIAPGTQLEFNYWISTAYSDFQLIAQIFAESLAQCGIKLNVESKPGEDLYAIGPGGILFGRQFDMVQLSSFVGHEPFCDLYLSEAIPGDPNVLDKNGAPKYPNGWGEDPMSAKALRLFDGDKYPYGWGAWNETGYSNPEYDQACKDALAVLPGQDDYIEKHFKVQEIFYRDLPVIPLFVRPKVAATRSEICGFILDPTDSEMWNIEEFDYGPGCEK